MHKWIEDNAYSRDYENEKTRKKKEKLRDEIETSYSRNSMPQNGKPFC